MAKTPRRGNPSAPDYPIDGRKAAEAVQQIIGQLLSAELFFPTTRQVAQAVNGHPLTHAAIVYCGTNRQRLRAAIQRYFRFFGPVEGCRLVGADLDAGACILDLVWTTPGGTVLVDELVANRSVLPGMAAFEERVDEVFEASRALFGDRLRGVRVCVFGAPAKSAFIEADGTESPLSHAVLP
ncbi:MAG: hypothetical protein QOH12_3016 [Solirubrobacteraceae bacterium]|jgi:hypothetical protein|nr:hypothetical protein [Solirubrobacteraceae bacterium]